VGRRYFFSNTILHLVASLLEEEGKQKETKRSGSSEGTDIPMAP